MKGDRPVPGPAGPGGEARLCTPADLAAQYERHHDTLRRAANGFFDGRRPDAAADAVEAVFARLWALATNNRLQDRGALWEPFLRRAVRNACIDIVRAEQTHQKHFPEGDPDQQRFVDFDPLGDAVAEDDERRRHLSRLPAALDHLSERHRQIVARKFWDQWTNQQIGSELGISGQAVGQQLRTALKNLHKEVTRDE